MNTGAAARLRAWWFAFVAGETGAPAELIEKVRLVEGVFPMLALVPGIGSALTVEVDGRPQRARSIADLLPADDELVELALAVVHEWSGRLLAPSAIEASAVTPEAAAGGTPAADDSPALPPADNGEGEGGAADQGE